MGNHRLPVGRTIVVYVDVGCSQIVSRQRLFIAIAHYQKGAQAETGIRSYMMRESLHIDLSSYHSSPLEPNESAGVLLK